MLRGSAGAIVLATGLAATALSASAIRDRKGARKNDRKVDPVAAPTAAPAAAPAPAPAATPGDSTSATARKPSAPFTPVLPMGTSPLPGGIEAIRSDSDVTISFDVPMVRTRLPQKFEHLVRATLPAVYGATVDTILAKFPSGWFAQQGNLLTELP